MAQLHRVVLAGCGGMGRRHLRSYRVLGEAEPGRAELAAVVDPELERAEFVAAEAEQLLGRRPAAFTSLDAAASAVPELDVADIVAAASVHHRIAQVACAAGMHVLCEKPMAPTVAACRAMQRAARAGGPRAVGGRELPPRPDQPAGACPPSRRRNLGCGGAGEGGPREPARTAPGPGRARVMGPPRHGTRSSPTRCGRRACVRPTTTTTGPGGESNRWTRDLA